MKHEPFRHFHPAWCGCTICEPRRTINLRPIVLAAIAAAVPVYGLLWAAWTMLP